MIKINHPSENCKNWVGRLFDKIGEELEECPVCSSNPSFEIKDIQYIWRWDISLPTKWHWGNWNELSLYPVSVPIILVKCPDCNTIFKVYPSFVTEGTTLTKGALIMVAFIYEASDLSWRKMVFNLCDEGNRIAHSTLYRASHGLGLLLINNIKERHAALEYLTNLIPGDTYGMPWPNLKSRYEHTRKREENARFLLNSFYILLLSFGFTTAYFYYLKQIHLFFAYLDQPLPHIYDPNINRMNTS